MKGLGRWVDAQTARSPAEALALLRAMPGGPFIGVPLRRFVDRENIHRRIGNADLNRLLDEAPIRAVDVSTLVGIQHTVERSRVEQYLTDPAKTRKLGDKAPGGWLVDIPMVIHSEGTNFLWDGHHRATATMLLGAKLLRARYVDLDAYLRSR
jgi:hypothetical protein